MVHDQELFFSDRSKFRDPLDRTFKMKTLSKDQAKRFIGKHKKTIQKDVELYRGPKAKADIRPHVFIKHWEAQAHSIFKTISIACFTDALESDTQWDQYADGHAGIAYEFSQNSYGHLVLDPLPILYRERLKPATLLQFLNTAFGVEDLPKDLFLGLIEMESEPDGAENSERALDLFGRLVGNKSAGSWQDFLESFNNVYGDFLHNYFYQKKMSYSWEREWRALSDQNGYSRYLKSHSESDEAEPYLALEAIYVGANADCSVSGDVVRMCEGRLPVYQMRYREDGTFIRISFQD